MRAPSILLLAGIIASSLSAQTVPATGTYVPTTPVPIPTESTVIPGTVRFSPHDFSQAAWNQGSGSTGQQIKPGQLCATCHIPHVGGRDSTGDDRTSQPLLWGRKMSTANYTMYSSPSLQGTTDSQPTGSSRLCLSCHDGSVALDLYHRRTTSQSNVFVLPQSRVPGQPSGAAGTDFRADHPISITYEAGTGQGQDPYLRATSSPFPGVVPGQRIADILEGNKVQCSSCHDVHNVQVPADAPHLLRIRNDRPGSPSDLCNACHLK